MGEEPQQQPAALDPLADEKAGKVWHLRLAAQNRKIKSFLDSSLVEYPACDAGGWGSNPGRDMLYLRMERT